MTSSPAPRTMWTDDEITTLLALVNEKKLSDLLDSKWQKNKDIFMDLERCLKEQGLTWTWEERLLLCKSGGEPSKWKWFDKMSLLLGDHPMVQAINASGVGMLRISRQFCEITQINSDDENDVLVFGGGVNAVTFCLHHRVVAKQKAHFFKPLLSVSQDTNTTIKYSWCKLRKNAKTAIAVAKRQLRKQPQPTAARGESAGLEERKPVPEDGLSARLDAKRRCDHRSPLKALGHTRHLKRLQKKHKPFQPLQACLDDDSIPPTPLDCEDNSEEPEMAIQEECSISGRTDFGQTTELTMLQIKLLEEENNHLISELVDTKGQLRTHILSEECLKEKPDMLQFYTGMPNFILLWALFLVLERGISHTSLNCLTKFQEMFVFLICLRLNVSLQDLAYR
ncbi:hypothetical protein HPB51_007027 [Rhipicephalus microplus]|uniref:Uncharacterized protein n=1 Tax=Rhipicephalus microplus TaxID=6941 RepID=A0A9J6DZK6_RHIMP|nr:hypothetical protein HPB51_007027 [Rhipicephalus microplus]